MRIDPYLNFDGTCEEAFRRYAEVLGGSVTSLHRFAGTPAAEHVPAELQGKVMHATLQVGDYLIMGSDSPGMYERPQGMYVSINLADAAEGKRIFDALAEGGTVSMPFEKTFWAEGYGMLVDRFGTPWMVNCGPEA